MTVTATATPDLERGRPVAAQSELRRRINDAIDMHDGMDRSSDPQSTPEIRRELEMLSGALQGVEQRVGELAATLRPILHPRAISAVTSPPDPLKSADDFELETVMAKQLRGLQERVSEIEGVLGHLSVGARI